MKFLNLLFLLTILSLTAFSQNFKYGNVTIDDYTIDKNKIDSSANAIVIQEFGKSTMMINDSDGKNEYSHFYWTRKRRIPFAN